jgi:aminopeptidase N
MFERRCHGRTRRQGGALVVALFLWQTACGTPPPRVPASGTFVRADDGTAAPFHQVLEDLMGARVAYVGERHDEHADHVLQLRIVQAMHRRDPSLAVGMEMFQRPFQEALDDWVRGAIEEPELLARTEYERRWGYDFAMYRPILDYAREHGLSVVALNAPAERSHAVAKGGVEGLPPEERARLPEMDMDDTAHRALVTDALAAHGDLGAEALERFYEAQVLWDETMAETVAETLAGPAAPRRMVVLAGTMHVRGGRGIPRRAARRGAQPYRIVLPAEALPERESGDDTPPWAHWWWLASARP